MRLDGARPAFHLSEPDATPVVYPFLAMKSLRASVLLILAAALLALTGCQGMPANVPTPAAQSPDVRSPSQPKPPTP